MRSYLLIAVLAAAVTSAEAGETTRGVFDPQRQLGIAEFNEHGDGCLTIRNPDLREKETIYLVSLQEPQTYLQSSVAKKLPQSCSKSTVPSKETSFYSLQLGKLTGELVPPAIAVAGYDGTFTVAAGKVRADLNNDGIAESFRACTSMEGLHLTVWAGESLKGKRLWHEYFYLGYDVEPDCTAKDFEQ